MRISLGGLLAATAVVIVAATCVRLGFWQLDRLEQRKAFNATAASGQALPPLVLDSGSLRRMADQPEAFLYRRAIARGRYDSEGELLLRGRSSEGRPGVHLIAPLRLGESGGVILVNRGWLPSPDAAIADPRPHRLREPLEVTGVLQLLPSSGGEASPLPIQVGDTTIATYRRLDRSGLSAAYGVVLPPLYLQRTDSALDRLPLPVPLPSFDEGPHLGYAVQWFSFAAIAVIGFLVVLTRKKGDTPSKGNP